MADRQLRIDLDVVTQKAQQHLKEAEQASGQLGEGIYDTRTKGQQLADAMELMAQIAKQELQAAEAAADALSSSLGPEMVAKLEQGGQSIDGLVSDLHRAGLTYQDVRDDADRLAQAVKAVDDVRPSVDNARVAAKGVGDEMHHTADETERTGSVVANFAGNAAQELPGVAQAMGPMNMAIGQFVEYAAEGNIKLGKFITAAGGLGLAAAAFYGISTSMENIAETKAFKREEVDAYTTALKGAKSELQAIVRKITDSNKLEWRVLGDTADILPALTSLGLTVQSTAQLIAGGKDKIDAWGQAMLDAGADADTVAASVLGLKQQVDLESDAVKNAAASAKFFDEQNRYAGLSVGEIAAQIKDSADKAEYYKSRVDAAKGATEDLGGETDDTAHSLKLFGIDVGGAVTAVDAMDESYRRLTGHVDERSAWRNLGDALAEFKTTADDTESSWRDIEEASDGAVTAASNYIEQAKGIPPEIKTQLYTMLDEGKLNEVVLMLDNWKNGVDIPLRVIKPGELGYEKRASGGPARGLTLVGEQGPELVDLPSGSYVHDATSTSRMLAPAGSAPAWGGGTMNVTLVTARPDARAVLAVLKDLARSGVPNPWR